MSYTALYRKFRPANFGEVRGQEHIVTTLKNQLKLGRIGHAYLFTGTRGTGKTSVAKIMAKAVNCENPDENGPCGECGMCKSIQTQTSMNVVELDAASNNGVDSIREIVDAVQYSPAEGKYKVYIIDEVHMLSTGAFNALLKTLEEPPSYVIFILATTEVNKIPITILSRCQRYDFHRIGIDTIAGQLASLAEKEGIEAEEKAIRYIAKVADGSMRDGLSLFDQCIAFYLGEKLTYDKVLDVLGAVDTDVFFRILDAVIAGDVKAALKVIEEIILLGRDLSWFINEWIWYMRNLLLLKSTEDCEDMIEMSADNLSALRQQAETIGEDILIRYIRVLSELVADIRYSGQKRVLTEVAIVKLCKPEMGSEHDFLTIKDRIRRLEAMIENGNFVAVTKENSTDGANGETSAAKEASVQKVVYPSALPEDVKIVAGNWNEIVGRLDPALSSTVKKMTLSISSDGNDSLLLVSSYEALVKVVNSEENIKLLKNCINEYVKKEVSVDVKYISAEEEHRGLYPDIERLISSGIPVDVI
ncbi:MAG: DNA polymerase III subunit gamma/tau [Lachnospiraceae bacterium]|nr:DNA polymerase III subunit gamma/tau [Lachnospiraceae bacterium]